MLQDNRTSFIWITCSIILIILLASIILRANEVDFSFSGFSVRFFM